MKRLRDEESAHARHGVRGGDALNVSLVLAGLVPADVLLPLLCHRVGVPVRKCNKETVANREILGDKEIAPGT
jgi:hypothetical protein